MSQWLAARPELSDLPLERASTDASFRRYFRLRDEVRSWVVMDAPPPMEDCGPFIAVAELLRSLSINVPVVIDADLGAGFVLMTDLGEVQYLDALGEDPSVEERLYADAIDTLIAMQAGFAAAPQPLPPYDEGLLRTELELFRVWLCGRHLGVEFTRTETRAWSVLCDHLVTSALAQERVFVHRDYHSRNLMVMSSDNPGVLDFQDAMLGPLTYDLVSLLKDCYRTLPPATVARFVDRFVAGREAAGHAPLDREQFQRDFDLMGVQRHLKAAGIFARLLHRDGKPGYLPDVPRTLRYIVDAAAHYPALTFLRDLVESRCLPALRDET